MKIISLLGVCLLLLVAACQPTPLQQTTTTSDTIKAPEFSLSTVSGRQVSLSSNIEQNKPTVLYFMSSTCPTCAKNWAALNEVIADYEGKVDFVAISVDPTDTNAVLEELAVDRGFKFDTSAGNPSLALQYDVKKQTAKFAIDAQGNILARHDGALTAQEWREFFDLALGTSVPPSTPQEVTSPEAVQEESPNEAQAVELEQETQPAQESNLDPAPSFSVVPVNGPEISLQQSVAEGKPTVVYFTASTCPICARNYPSLNTVSQEYADRINFVAISVDPTDDVSTMENLVTNKDLTFSVAPGNPTVALAYSVTKQTAKFAIDANGNIVQRHDGFMTEEEWRTFFDQLVA